MENSKLIFLIVSILLFCSNPQRLIAQDCDCTLAEVESNTVTPCTEVVGTIVTVATAQQFRSAINQANQSGGNMTILIEDGTYAVASTASYPYITASNLVIRSVSGNRDAVILTGQGMQDVAPLTEIVLYLVGDNITVADLTIIDCGNHGIAITSDDHLIHNVKVQNTYEQLVKANDNGELNENTIIQCSLFEYTAGVGPQWYIGGLDIHGGHGWTVRDNVFRNINSPSQSVAEHAIHFWDDSADNTIERNKITNCDRGIGFGLGSSPSAGGVIRNNTIVNEGITPFHDVGIGLETSPDTEVYNNTVMVAYQNAIEYRFEATENVLITNNLTNRPIRSRNGGQATLSSNVTNAQLDWFVDPYAGDLHLVSAIGSVVGQGDNLPSVTDDIDKQARPTSGAFDIGADQYLVSEDADMDGYTADVDCDDTNPDINPGATEVPYNGIDEDCNDETLDDDLDQDGFLLADDCDDVNADINPDATEVPYNGIDEDCNDETLDDDLDQDGFLLANDCDDVNADINPDATEVPYNGIDEDCNDETLDDDLDQDGFLLANDCDDVNADINPDATEVPYNGIDEDCNDETLDDDLDQDGFLLADDCDDDNADINPDATEVPYNGIDEDCNDETLDDDLDQDGFLLADDCDDDNANINPDATEVPYNGIDEDCNDETLDDDLDQDGFLLADDCNDDNADINPDATEIPDNGVDEDCNGSDLVTSTSDIREIAIKVYPSLATDIVYWGEYPHTTFLATIYSTTGQVMLSQEVTGSIQVGSLSAGTYVLVLDDQTNGVKAVNRFAVVK